MRPDHTAHDFAQPQPVLAAPMEDAEGSPPQRPFNAFTRVTFCFAWLFGLEPFLAGPVDEVLRSRGDRH
ncbi:hypothetical protein PQR75_36085 [Paraburkholderia fungorum]|jgi:hypothetical protein|uniref:hypothetical protein n=1 Tax=Paraburkholderia fungorum TaxID=134537 RepID=UPI0038B77797